jgi:hypothetical protein
MKKTILFISCFIIMMKFMQAQASLGIFNVSIVVNPDTVAFNDTVSISFDVVNTGDQFFVGVFNVDYAVNSFQGVLDSFSNNVFIDTIQPFHVVVPDHIVSPDKYAIGDNIVVIWPVAQDPNVVTTDSGETNIYVDTLLGIGSPAIKARIKVFYKSNDHSLFINYGDLVTQIKDVTCYSILGDQIKKYNHAVSEIFFAENSPQVFLLVIRTKQGETVSFKILRM